MKIRSLKVFLKILSRSLLGLACLALFGCATKYEHLLEKEQATHAVEQGDPFKHLVVLNRDFGETGPVVIFIEGDGIPWRTKNKLNRDPTSDDLLMLEFALKANFPAMYVGRPCYFGLEDNECGPYWFTHGRYSEAVVKSMAHAISAYAGIRPLILVGHSGGGTIATLLSLENESVQGLVTIAGNFDVGEWSRHHGYSELIGSLDPMQRPALPERVKQVHFYSPYDENILPNWVEGFASRQMQAKLIKVPVRGHAKAWESQQEQILEVIENIRLLLKND